MSPRPIRPIRAVCLVLAASACAAAPETPRPDSAAREVLRDSYRKLSSYYIDPINLKTVGLDGLKRLRRIDPSLDFVHWGGAVSLLAKTVPVGSWPAPRGDDPVGWTDLTTDALRAARAVSPKVAARSTAALSDAVLRGATSSFDRYTRYAGPVQARRERALREGFGGPGIAIGGEGEIVSIRRVRANTPASRAGLRVGDRITHVDDRPVAGMGRAEVTALLRGPVGSPVRLGIVREAGGRTLTVEIARTLMLAPTVTSRRREGLLIIKVTGFNQGTARSIGEAIARARRGPGQGLAGVVLDLRSNPGGLLDQAVAVADLFLDDGRVIATAGRHPESFQTFDATWGKAAADTPLALLINGKSASAAEIVAAALRDRGRAVVIGSTSYGKGSVQTIMRLPNEGELTMTWARVIAPSGIAIQDRGVVPAICTSAKGARALLGALRRGDGARLPRRRDPDLARAACPPRIERPDADLEIARLVLRDRELYARVLAAGRPAVAGRAGASTASTAARP